jgi:peptidoglycan/LPS O-acetylase OafA/YrhL
MKQRYSELDAIRGIAAIFVVLYHYSVQYGTLYGTLVQPIFSFEFGKFGVELFFIVSGFVIFLTLNRTVNSSDFIVSRFSRLYPTYWVAVMLSFLIVTIFTLPKYNITVEHALVNLTMLQRFFKVPDVDGVYWTLIIELSFYIIMYILFVTKQLKKIDTISILWLFVIILLNFIEKHYGIHLPSILRFFLMLEYGNLFIAGIMFYKIMHNGDKLHYMIVFITLVTEYYLRNEIALYVSLYYFLFLLFVTNNLKMIAAKPLIYLGTISYSLYLIHQNIGYVIIRWLNAHELLNSISIIVVPLVISISIAALMQRYVEKPSLAFIRDKWKGSNMRKWLIK